MSTVPTFLSSKSRRSPTPSRSPPMRLDGSKTAYSTAPSNPSSGDSSDPERRKSLRALSDNARIGILHDRDRDHDHGHDVDSAEDEDEEDVLDDRVPLRAAYVSADPSDRVTSLKHGRLKRGKKGSSDDGEVLAKSRNRSLSYSFRNRHGSYLRRWFMHTRQRFWWTLLAIAMVLLALGGGRWYKVRSATIDGRSEPYYPTPLGGTSQSWAAAYEKAGRLVKTMTLAEKVNVTTGTGWMMGLCVGNTGEVRRLNFPSLCLQDGPIALRFADNITVSPAGVSVGATWNKKLMYKRGIMQGLEARAKGVNVLLGPSVGPLGRHPAGGRNWEGFGSDPVLQGIAAAATIRGIQEQGVIATIKHFVGNEQEHFRQSFEYGTLNAISSTIDDRSLHEVYGWPFMDSIREGVGSVMCSYNQVNHSYACQNSKLMNGLLKDEWGFQGFVQSDWLAQRSGVASALAGLDMSMPGDGHLWMDSESYFGPQLAMAALNASLPMFRLNDMATRVVAAWYQMGQDEWERPRPVGKGGPNFSSWTNDREGLFYPGTDDPSHNGVVNRQIRASDVGTFSHSDLARRIAAEAITLLKNEDSILPLGRDGWPQSAPQLAKDQSTASFRVAVIGEDATVNPDGANACADRGCNKGTLGQGWGSGSAEYPYLDSPVDAFRQTLYADRVVLSEFLDNTVPPSKGSQPYTIEEQDLCIVFVNADGGEGFLASEGIKGDRNDLELQHNANKLILHTANNCGRTNPRLNPRPSDSPMLAKTIVVMHTVGPVIVEQFIDHPDVAAVLNAHLPGQEAGHSLTDIIFGDLNPSGHLPYTMGKSLADHGPGAQVMYKTSKPIPEVDFHEGLHIDYRWFDANDITPRFEFGFGLSYTTFDIDKESINIELSGGGDWRPDPFLGPRPRKGNEPPHFDETPPGRSEALAPAGFRKLDRFIYPWIQDSDIITKDSYRVPPGTFPREPSPAGGDEGGHPELWEAVAIISVDITNQGDRDGMAVPQLYLVFPNDVVEEFDTPTPDLPPRDSNSNPNTNSNSDTDSGSPRPQRRQAPQSPPSQPLKSYERIAFPPRVLRAFQKLHIGRRRAAPRPVHETVKDYDDKVNEPTSSSGRQRVSFVLTRRDVSYWSVRRQSWVVPAGTFGVEIGFSSRDIRVRATLF